MHSVGTAQLRLCPPYILEASSLDKPRAHSRRENGFVFSPLPACEARGGEGLGVGGASIPSPYPGSHRYAMFADPPRRERGEGKDDVR